MEMVVEEVNGFGDTERISSSLSFGELVVITEVQSSFQLPHIPIVPLSDEVMVPAVLSMPPLDEYPLSIAVRNPPVS